MAKKRAQQEEILEISWTEKFTDHRSSFLLVGTIVAALFGMSIWHLSDVRDRSLEAWRLLGDVTNAEVGQYNAELKIRDLSGQVQKLVRKSIKDKESLPSSLRDNIATLDDLALRDLPQALRVSVLRKHHLEQLEKELPKAKNTTAEPWMYYCMANLYFAEGNFDKTHEIYTMLGRDYPHHILFNEVEKFVTFNLQHQLNKSKITMPTVEILTPQEENSKKVEVATSKGKFAIEVIATENISRHFLTLVEAGFYNGLTFYSSSFDEVYTGCPLGNGLGESQTKTKAEKLDEGYLRRGLVVMKHDPVTKNVSSHFYIVKQSSLEIDGLKPVVVLGSIDKEGMKIVDSLQARDVLLDIHVQESTSPEN